MARSPPRAEDLVAAFRNRAGTLAIRQRRRRRWLSRRAGASASSSSKNTTQGAARARARENLRARSSQTRPRTCSRAPGPSRSEKTQRALGGDGFGQERLPRPRGAVQQRAASPAESARRRRRSAPFRGGERAVHIRRARLGGASQRSLDDVADGGFDLLQTARRRPTSCSAPPARQTPALTLPSDHFKAASALGLSEPRSAAPEPTDASCERAANASAPTRLASARISRGVAPEVAAAAVSSKARVSSCAVSPVPPPDALLPGSNASRNASTRHCSPGARTRTSCVKRARTASGRLAASSTPATRSTGPARGNGSLKERPAADDDADDDAPPPPPSSSPSSSPSPSSSSPRAKPRPFTWSRLPRGASAFALFGDVRVRVPGDAPS